MRSRVRGGRPPGGFTLVEMLAVLSIIGVLFGLLLPAVQAVRHQSRRLSCANNLMQLGIALTSYEASHRVYPPGVVNPGGPVRSRPAGYHFGWIAQLLPHIEAGNLYDRLNFQVDVYDAGNDTARATSIRGLHCPHPAAAGTPAGNSYAACHHDAEAPIAADNRGVFFLNSRIRPGDVTDGLAQTIFLGERRGKGLGQGWAAGTRSTLRNTGLTPNHPALDAIDLAYDKADDPDPDSGSGPATPGLAVGGFSSYHPGGANFLLGDGSVRLLSERISPHVYRLLGARDDGEPVDADPL